MPLLLRTYMFEKDGNACRNNSEICLNDGICIATGIATYICNCAANYSGVNCESGNWFDMINIKVARNNCEFMLAIFYTIVLTASTFLLQILIAAAAFHVIIMALASITEPMPLFAIVQPVIPELLAIQVTFSNSNECIFIIKKSKNGD